MQNRFNQPEPADKERLEIHEPEPIPAELRGLLDVSTEDRLRGAIVESLHWLDIKAPGRAYSTLLEALRIRSLNPNP